MKQIQCVAAAIDRCERLAGTPDCVETTAALGKKYRYMKRRG